MFAMMIRLGLGPEEIRRRQMSFAVVHAETDFHRELRPGDVIVLESAVLKLGEKSVTFRHQPPATSGQIASLITTSPGPAAVTSRAPRFMVSPNAANSWVPRSVPIEPTQ